MWQVYRKELLELVRDRKTLFFMIALPLIVFPIIFGIMGLVVANVAIDEKKKVLNYALVNGDRAPKFTEAMFYHRDFKLTEINLSNEQEIRTAILQQQVDFVIKINEDYQADSDLPNADKPNLKAPTWQLFFNNSSQINSVRQKVEKVFTPYLAQIRERQLAQLSLSEQQYQLLAKPVVLKVVNTADERENFGEQVGGFLPYLLIMLCLTGAMYPAIDIGAGEKERGTLETLLLTPISRTALVMGKFFTVMTTSAISALVTISSLVFWGYIVGKVFQVDAVGRILASVGGFDFVLMLFMLIPVAAIFAALALAISIYARSFKEGQNYMSALSMLGFVPVMMAMLPGIELKGTWAYVPVTNVALAIKEILKGTIEYSAMFGIFISSLVFAVIAVGFCVHWFKKESVLFR